MKQDHSRRKGWRSPDAEAWTGGCDGGARHLSKATAHLARDAKWSTRS